MTINVSPDELLTIIGMKETEIIKLRIENAQLRAAVEQARPTPPQESQGEPDGAPAHDH